VSRGVIQTAVAAEKDSTVSVILRESHPV